MSVQDLFNEVREVADKSVWAKGLEYARESKEIGSRWEPINKNWRYRQARETEGIESEW